MLRDLGEMVGQRLLVHVTYVHADGHDERVEFVGHVTSVSPLVTISRPGREKPFTLPPDPQCYRSAAPGAYTLDSTGETVLNPRYETTWRVRAPAGSTDDPKTQAFRPSKDDQ
jgi:hypothetical protein